MAESLIEMRGITKHYGRIQALTDVTLTINRNEIVGLLGDNGAGKSTLIKVLSGAVPLTSGEIWIKGRRVDIRTTNDAIANGIETIYQDSALVPQLSIARNLFLGRELRKAPAFLDRLERTAAGASDTPDARDDVRVRALRRAIPLLVDGQPDRVRRILDLLSDHSHEPIAAAHTQSALGADPHGTY